MKSQYILRKRWARQVSLRETPVLAVLLNQNWEGMCRPCPYLTQANEVRLSDVLQLVVTDNQRWGPGNTWVWRMDAVHDTCHVQASLLHQTACWWSNPLPSHPQREGLELLTWQGVEKPTWGHPGRKCCPGPVLLTWAPPVSVTKLWGMSGP